MAARLSLINAGKLSGCAGNFFQHIVSSAIRDWKNCCITVSRPSGIADYAGSDQALVKGPGEIFTGEGGTCVQLSPVS